MDSINKIFSKFRTKAKSGYYANNDYDIIMVKDFLTYYFDKNLFIEDNYIWKLIRKKFPNSYYCDTPSEISKLYIKDGFNEEMLLKIKNLHFYQQEVGYDKVIENNGLVVSDEPILVVKYLEKYIIKNGYHRIFNHIYNGKLEILCYVATIT